MEDLFRIPLRSLDYFTLLVAEEERIPLLEAATSIAQIEYPHLQFQHVTHHIDQLTLRIQQAVPPSAPPLQKITLLHSLLYQEIFFRGDFHLSQTDVELHCMNFVLKTRRGADTVLGIIYLELAQAIGLHARGVLLPEQMLVKIRLEKANGDLAEVLINPLDGKSLTMEDLHDRLQPFKVDHGLTDEYDMPSALFLQTASHKEILAFMLNKMHQIYLAQSQWKHVIQTLDYLIALQPSQIEYFRERGYALIKHGNTQKAIADLEYYLQFARTQPVADIDVVTEQVSLLKKS